MNKLITLALRVDRQEEAITELRQEVKELNQKVADLSTFVRQLANELQRDRENAAKDRENLLLRLELALVKSGRELPPPPAANSDASAK